VTQARAWFVVLVTAAAIIPACTKLDTSPSSVFGLSIDSLPFPSIVQNDTMRDTSGKIRPLVGQAYNIQGAELDSTIVTFFSLDANLLRVNAQNYPVAGDTAPTTVRIVAQAQTLQSTPYTVNISLRPDTVSQDSVLDSAGTAYVTSDTTQTIDGFCTAAGAIPGASAGMVAWLRHRPDTGTTYLGVDNYIVTWQIISPAGQAGTGAPSDTTHLAYLVNSSVLNTVMDTTKNGGFSTRYLLFGARAFDTTMVPYNTQLTFVVQAIAKYRGVQVPGMIIDTIKFTHPRSC
jgi:hypothetical protein